MTDLFAQPGATHGIPIDKLRAESARPAAKLFESGAHAVWALDPPGRPQASGDWCTPHYVRTRDPHEAWMLFWARLDALTRLGAIWFEPWLFESAALDAEPLMPLDPDVLYADGEGAGDAVADLTRRLIDTADDLAEDRGRALDCQVPCLPVPRFAHAPPPALRGVARLRVEAATPGRAWAYAQRMALVERRVKDSGVGIA